jgi:succinate dehydrogenase / fumarate reductase cytochrome b subunit
MSGFLSSTIGKKYLMGLTGLVWAGFVFTHMAGNMTILVSPDLYNQYGHSIVSNKVLLYGVETLILLSLIVHVALAINLTMQNKHSKGIPSYNKPTGPKRTPLASQTMIIQGTIILVFIISHLITFKYGPYYETTIDGVKMRDLAKLMGEVFKSPGAVTWYVVSLLLLCAHLKHGFGSVFQSFGLLHPSYQAKIKAASWAYAIIVTVGFISQPLYVFMAS